jgi:hypothetical protein
MRYNWCILEQSKPEILFEIGDYLARKRVTFGRLVLQIFFAQLSRARLGPSCFPSSSSSQDLAIFVENSVSYAIFSPNSVNCSII